MVDLILKNGQLMDPKNGLTGKRGDIVVKDGRIVAVGVLECKKPHRYWIWTD